MEFNQYFTEGNDIKNVYCGYNYLVVHKNNDEILVFSNMPTYNYMERYGISKSLTSVINGNNNIPEFEYSKIIDGKLIVSKYDIFILSDINYMDICMKQIDILDNNDKILKEKLYNGIMGMFNQDLVLSPWIAFSF